MNTGVKRFKLSMIGLVILMMMVLTACQTVQCGKAPKLVLEQGWSPVQELVTPTGERIKVKCLVLKDYETYRAWTIFVQEVCK